MFTIISYLIGVFIFATIVGQVGNVITNRNANRLEFERLLDGAKTYMRHHKVPGGMKRRVLRWYDYSWSRYKQRTFFFELFDREKSRKFITVFLFVVVSEEEFKGAVI